MKADVSYNDLIGTVSVDISDDIAGVQRRDDLSSISKSLKLDEDRFTLIGLSIYGTDSPSLSLLCVDKEKSKEGKEHIVSMHIDLDDATNVFDLLFKRMHIVLYDKHDNHYPALKYNEEVRYMSFHTSENVE